MARAKVAEDKAKADAELEEQRQREMQALQTDATDLAGPQVRSEHHLGCATHPLCRRGCFVAPLRGTSTPAGQGLQP